MSLAAGTQVGRFRVVRKLGAGGMGEVYLADDPQLGRKVALKILPAAVAADSERVRHFRQEAQMASAISHANVAHIYDLGEANGSVFLALEYVNGEPLSVRLQDGPLLLREVVAFGRQAALALHAAHAQGIVHRDLKPANLMITRDGQLKVVDFGLALMRPKGRPSEDTAPLADLGLVLGTVQYMSPEQALGREVDHRSDIFSLGATLYEMATGHMAFEADNAQQALAQMLSAEPPPPTQWVPDLPASLERLILKCLAKAPADRHQSGQEIADELAALLAPTAPPVERKPGGKLSVVIVDDEDLARMVVREYAAKDPGLQVVAECGNGFEAVKTIGDLKPDLVFLDVQMPKLDGFEVLELIGPDVAVIFCTAFDQYAMKAFDAHAVDYLLKPFRLDRFQTAVQRARQRLGERAPVENLAQAARPSDQFAERIVVKDGAKVHIIPIDKLDYVEAQDDYVSLYSAKKGYLKQQTISSVEASLDPKRFLRIHRSYIVNLERVAKIEPYTKDSRVAVLTDGTQLPVSRAGYSRLKAVLDDRV
jgi:two-component system LytT family response regulator